MSIITTCSGRFESTSDLVTFKGRRTGIRGSQKPNMEKKRSWTCTLVIQASFCIAFYLAFNLGQPQNPILRKGSARRPQDVYFLSVRGGYRSLEQQTHLLKQIENAAKAYKVMFVVNISELGEDDPLTQNASRLFTTMNVPWHTTSASKNGKVGCFQKQINITKEKTFKIIGVDTGSLEDAMLTGSKSAPGKDLVKLLAQTLRSTTDDWFVVVGYHPVVGCHINKERMEPKFLEPLHHLFIKYGVNAYLSKEGCFKHTLEDGVAYIGTPDPTKGETDSGSMNGSSAFEKKMADGFLLHRVAALEMTTYFITSEGLAVNRTVTHQRAKDAV